MSMFIGHIMSYSQCRLFKMYPAPDSDKVLHKKLLRCISLVIAWWSEVFCLVLRGAICKVLPSGYLTVCHGIDGP